MVDLTSPSPVAQRAAPRRGDRQPVDGDDVALRGQPPMIDICEDSSDDDKDERCMPGGSGAGTVAHPSVSTVGGSASLPSPVGYRVALLGLEAKSFAGYSRDALGHVCVPIDYRADYRSGGDGDDCGRLSWVFGRAARMCSESAAALCEPVPICNLHPDGLVACVQLLRSMHESSVVLSFGTTGSAMAEIIERDVRDDPKQIAGIERSQSWSVLPSTVVRIFRLPQGPTVLCQSKHMSYHYTLIVLAMRAVLIGRIVVGRGTQCDVTLLTPAIAQLSNEDEAFGRFVCPGCQERFDSSQRLQQHKEKEHPSMIRRRGPNKPRKRKGP